MNPTHATELLERAADSVTPAETDPASRLVSLGRRSVRRRRAWTAAGSAAVAAVAAVVAVPLAMALPDPADPAGRPATTVSFGGLTVAVPKGWRTSRITTFDSCTAEPRTLYLAAQKAYLPARKPGRCPSDGQAWMALVQKGVGLTVNPKLLVVRDERLLHVAQADPAYNPSMWSYRPYTEKLDATAALLSGDEQGREQLLKRITWPDGPAAPPSGGLALPARITSALSAAPPSNGMVNASDAETLRQIRTTLARLRDPIPAGEECTLQTPGAVGISLGGTDLGGGVNVVLGDATCPQAVSTRGGRVRVPAGLGKQLLELIVASDRAASKRPTKD